MPDLDGMRRLWDAWHECGRTSGAQPLLWAEIRAYCEPRSMCVEDQAVLHRMSEAYLEGLSLTSRLSISPMEAATQ